MNTYAIYLKPRGPLASFPLSSDTLFGAVCWGLSVLGIKKDLGDWLKQYTGSPPPFAFSAAFPAWLNQDGSPLLRFYPRPLTFGVDLSIFRKVAEAASKTTGAPLKTTKVKLSDRAKLYKKFNLISETIFTGISTSAIKPEDAFSAILLGKSNYYLASNALLESDDLRILQRADIDIQSNFYVETPVQHNQIDRMGGSTVEGMLFYQNEVYFNHHAGLWALVRADTNSMRDLIEPSLRYLADSGFGAKRTVGRGHFHVHIDNAPPFPNPKDPNSVMMLSRYLPADSELAGLSAGPLAYRMTTLRPKREHKFPRLIAGMSTPPIYKQAVRMFEPGSVFPFTHRQDIFGRLAEVVPAEDGGPVYQSGATIPVFMHV